MRARSARLIWPFAGLLVAVAPLRADEIHRNEFAGKNTQFIKGEGNLKVEEKAHELSAERSRSLPTSERIKLTLAAGKNETNYVYYYYPTPAAPLVEELTAEMFVHSNRAGVQLLARVVFPRIRNPKQLDEPITRLVKLDDYKAPAGGWQKLILKRPSELLQAQKQALRLEMKGDPDVSGAYVDRLVLNLYTGAGEIEVFIDNLEIGPVKPGTGPPGRNDEPVIKGRGGVPVEFERGKLTVGGTQMFPRFIRYSGTPLAALREAGFNVLALPPDAPPELLEDAIDNYKFWIVPQIPPIAESNPDDPASPLAARDVDALVAAIRKFQSRDAVLFWDLGQVRSEDYRRASRMVEAIRAADPRRPVAADVWDGFNRFAIPVQMVGAHRDPLMTSLELDRYARWLNQRKILGSGSKFNWTWIQTHMPEWQVRLLYDRPIADDFPEPIGPQPEQIRLLTYIALANGCKGLGFWTDRFLADSRQGRDRLLQMALLNQEIEMLEPLLMDTTGEIRWIQSSHPSIKVALLRTTGKGLLALPIWLGSGAQYVPPQGAVQGLKFSIPVVPDGMEPWEITPVRVQSLQNQMKLTPEGTEITLNEFDLTAAIVFTSDFEPDGLLAAWQKYTKRAGKFAAAWACDLAEEQMKKVLITHKRLEQVSPPVYDARRLIHEAEKQLVDARRSQAANNDEDAYMSAVRTMRPLRLLMRAHWDRAVKSLSHPAATPYSVSFHTLPRHWELAKTIAASTLGENELRDGDFNSLRPADARGVAVTTLPGWTVQEVALDDVIMIARIVNSAEAKTPEPVIEEKKPPPYSPTSPLKRVVDPQPRQPPLGAGVLRLTVTPRPLVLKKDEKAPPEPQSLERVFLAVNSPPVKFAPGTWVRISGWMKVPAGVRASADGAMFFDTATGEAYAVRVNETLAWKQFFFYRKVPASGEIRVRMAMTGFGTVYFDDIRVEPFVPGDGNVPLSPLRGEGLGERGLPRPLQTSPPSPLSEAERGSRNGAASGLPHTPSR